MSLHLIYTTALLIIVCIGQEVGITVKNRCAISVTQLDEKDK